MKKKIVAIGLFPDRLDLLVIQGGRVTASRRLPVTFDSTADGWPLSLRKAGPALSDTVRDMKLTGWNAVVMYVNPTASAEWVAVKASGAGEAAQAAVLATGDSLGYPLALAVTAAMVVAEAGERKGRQNEKPNAESQEPQTAGGQIHVVVAADRDDHATALADLIEDAGLKFHGATPVDAATMVTLSSRALRDPAVRSGHLYLGEHRSFFVIVENGSMVFARPINLGMGILAAALTRIVRGGAGGGQAVEMDPAAARALLHRWGFPDRSQVIDQGTGLTGAQVIPLLQPVLQRLVVELRQSLRFGLAQEHRSSLVLRVSGPGSSIPNFAGIIGQELKLSCEVEAGDGSYDPERVDSPGSELVLGLSALEAGVLGRLNLQPRELARARQINRLQRWMWTGAAAGLAMVAMDGLGTHAKVKSMREQALALEARNSEAQSLHQGSQKMIEAIGAMASLENLIAMQVGSQVKFGACMQEMAGLVPASIRLTEIRFSQDGTITTATMQGYAFAEGGKSADSVGESKGVSGLESLIGGLKDSPLFEKVALGNVQVATAGSRPAQQFEVGMTGVAVPMMPLASSQAQAIEQEGPKP